MFWGKKPLLEELFLELLEGDVQVAHALRAELRAVELIRAIAREYADAAKGDDLHAVFRAEAELCRHAAEHHAPERAPLVLEREVMVPGGIELVVRDLAAHENGLELRHGVEQRLDEIVGFRYAEDHLLLRHAASPLSQNKMKNGRKAERLSVLCFLWQCLIPRW